MLKIVKPLLGIGLLALSLVGNATVVKFETSMGDFEVNLYDDKAPKTVANFLAYVEAGRYQNVIIHRSVPGFVVQGGGLILDAEDKLQSVEKFPNVVNEPVLSNLRGTIAMAKLAGDPNSASSEWFFNLVDNGGANAPGGGLDTQNGGFTVFGQVLGDGMEIVNAIAALPRLDSLPLVNYSQTDYDNGVAITRDHYVVIEAVTVIDTNTITHPELNPPANTLVNNSNNTNTGSESSGGGGAMFWIFSVLMLALFGRKKQF